MATMQDIADEVGVSKAAVSRILNGKGSFSQETILKVERVAHRLNYVPASALREGGERRTRRLAVVMPPSTSPYYGVLVTLVERVASEYEYDVTPCGSLFARGTEEEEFYDALRERGFDGVLMAAQAREPRLASELGIPVVTMGIKYSDEIPSVRSNNLLAGRLAARHLVGRGFRSLLYASHFPDSSQFDERGLGFVDAAKGLGADVTTYRFAPLEDENSEKNQITQMLLDSTETRGIFLESYGLTMRTYKTAVELGYQFPSMLSIVGYGSPYLMGYGGVDLTIVQEDTDVIVAKAVSTLVDLIEAGDSPAEPGKSPSLETLVPVSLRIGRTG